MRFGKFLGTIFVIALLVGAVFFVFKVKIDQKVAAPNTMSGTVVKPSPSDQGQAFLLPVSEANYLPIRNFNIPEPEIAARAGALFDVRSGRFLYSKNIDQKLPIASVTKLMSAVIILDSLNLEDVFTVPIEDINVGGLGADLYKDEQLKGADLFKIMLIKSSNDAALTFATYASRRGLDFVGKMNEKANTLAMFNTKFADPAGLDDNGTFSTASDLVKLVNYLRKYDIIWEVLKTRSTDVSSVDGKFHHHLVNTDKLLGTIPDIVGGKTGYTENALGAMVLTVRLNHGGNSLISVVLGSDDRFGETRKLIDWAKKAYRWN